ncbi:endonuclease exonuclease phosphatase family protein [Diaporthe amygdali]|uniref:endonuclease exonuclease phosphatase family protein n=1 Tax=Phomopsis amygdali TaxID=1214568 RepID=UPI0022FF0F0D|nr:endonuclease exonuclease phosphatase family protein [Diaporthe amygdali]KAJ0103766.1 endonuclease exonuclease phosphatase family protein [Diaporthe amygdali]
MALELKRRGDFRDVDDLSDFEFNDLNLGAMSGSLELYGTAPRTSTPQSLVGQQTGPNFLQPHIYDPQSSSWASFSNEYRTLKRGDILKIASWNLFFSVPAAAARASAAIAYMRTMFGQEPRNLVVMLQELRQESLKVVLEDKWAQQNFSLSDTEPPYFHYAGNESFGEEPDCIPSEYFTLMMISRNMPISSCCRVPFVSEMGRDALVVDIPVSEDHDPETSERPLRLCTTHLESLYTGEELRFRQLVQVSALLKGTSSQGQRIYGGLVGGDMNSVDPSEHNTHRAPEVGLKDVWEDEPAPKTPALKPFQKDITYGFIETFALSEAQDTTGKLGRFGIGLKTKVGSDDVWVSDHFGITPDSGLICSVTEGQEAWSVEQKSLTDAQREGLDISASDWCGVAPFDDAGSLRQLRNAAARVLGSPAGAMHVIKQAGKRIVAKVVENLDQRIHAAVEAQMVNALDNRNYDVVEKRVQEETEDVESTIIQNIAECSTGS